MPFIPRPLPPLMTDGKEPIDRLRIRLDNERQSLIVPSEDPDHPQAALVAWERHPVTIAGFARLAAARRASADAARHGHTEYHGGPPGYCGCGRPFP